MSPPALPIGAPERGGRFRGAGASTPGLLVLAVTVAPSTVWEILREAGIDPASKRSATTWAAFLRFQAEALPAADVIETSRRPPPRVPPCRLTRADVILGRYRVADKSVEQIWNEIHEARRSAGADRRDGPRGRVDAWTPRPARTIGFLPKAMRNLGPRLVVGKPFRVKELSGTTLVTSVGSFGDVPGFAIPFLRSPRAVSIVLGNVCREPPALEGEARVRDVVSMTLVPD
jgi:hypothetical protein